MSKIIINIKSDLDHSLVMRLVGEVIKGGFVSGEKQYCRASTYTNIEETERLVIGAKKTRGNTHSFIIYSEPLPGKQ